MRAAQVLLFPIPIDQLDDQADEASRRANSYCLLCGNSGWRQVEGGVTRCDCRRRRVQQRTAREVRVRIRVDHKAAAAGERA
jgi:hypothetical protein